MIKRVLKNKIEPKKGDVCHIDPKNRTIPAKIRFLIHFFQNSHFNKTTFLYTKSYIDAVRSTDVQSSTNDKAISTSHVEVPRLKEGQQKKPHKPLR
jgi:hypothetical protein